MSGLHIQWSASISSWVSHRQFKLFMSKMEVIISLLNPFLLLMSLFLYPIEKSYFLFHHASNKSLYPWNFLKYSFYFFFLLYPYYALYFISYCFLWDPSIMKSDVVTFMVKTMQNLPIAYWIKLNLSNMAFKALPDLILTTFPGLLGNILHFFSIPCQLLLLNFAYAVYFF